MELRDLIVATIRQKVSDAAVETEYRQPLVGFVSAGDPRFRELRYIAEPTHLQPEDLLSGARSVVSFFIPFAQWVVEANSRLRDQVAREWAVAYVETNTLIDGITIHLTSHLAERGIRAAAEPSTHNSDPVTLVSRWSQKSVAVLAGLGSFGLHQMVITDMGCAGRFGSLVIDAELPISTTGSQERCRYYVDGSCLECMQRCPAQALGPGALLDKQRCHSHLHRGAHRYEHIGLADVCGKCVAGPCAFESAVQ
jgi:epoxyqueuosine reductase QueG